VQLYSIFNLGARWGADGQRHAPAALLPGRRTPITIAQEAGCNTSLSFIEAVNTKFNKNPFISS
jgi:hypothetical protein